MCCVTVIRQDDDVDAAVEADLLEAVHELADDLIYALDGLNQLQEIR